MKFNREIFQTMSSRLLVLSAALVLGCGTKVSTGRNGHSPTHPSNSNPNLQDTSLSNEAQNDVDGNLADSTDLTPSSGTEKVPAESKVKSGNQGTGRKCSDDGFLGPDDVKLFCQELDRAPWPMFAEAFSLVCDQEAVGNLFAPACGWSGKGALDRYMRVLKSESAANDENALHYLSVASLTLGPVSFSYGENALWAFSDPEGFSKKFVLPEGAVIEPLGNGIVQRSEDHRSALYKFSIKGLAMTSFVGEVHVQNISPRLRVVLNAAVDEMEGLTHRSNLTFVYLLNDGREKQVSIEERIVPDAGQHELARQVMVRLDRIEQTNRFENSLRRED